MRSSQQQSYTLTVDQAIAEGRRKIIYPSLLLIIGLPLLAILILREPYPTLLSPMLFLIAIAIAAVYRAYQIPKWRIRVFTRVRNVYELQRRAEFAMLIPGELNPGLKKFEIWTPEQRQQWEEIQNRFNQADEFVDDPNLLGETKVYYSVWVRIFYLATALVSIGFGSLLILMPGENPGSFSAIWGYVFGTALIIGMGYFAYRSVRQMLNRKPQLIFTDLGLQTSMDQFRSWGEMIDVKIIAKGNGRYRSFHLQYSVSSQRIDFELEGLDTGRKKLDRLLRTYRGRSLQKITANRTPIQ